MLPVTFEDRQSEFSVAYEGLAFAENTMDVQDFAPALLALGQTFDRANSLLNGDKVSVNLKVRTTRPGSFEVALFLQQALAVAHVALSDDWLSSPADLIELVIGGGVAGRCLLALMKGLKGNKPRIDYSQADGVLFEAKDVRLFVPSEIARLYADKSIRENLEAFARPLFRSGVDKVVFKRRGERVESVDSTEAKYFHTEPADKMVSENVIPRQSLQIASLNFNKQGKWKLSDGANIHWYSMEDEDFLEQIQKGKRFGIKDILVCEVLLSQYLDDANKLKLDYTVRRVLQHIIPGEQTRLPNVDFLEDD